MKVNKIIMLCAAVMLCALTVSAQTRRDEKKVHEDQVPIAIRNSFQQEFGANEQSTAKGIWYIYFEQQEVNSRIVATPLAYIYRSKNDGKKIEIKYDAAGKLESAKGVVKKDS